MPTFRTYHGGAGTATKNGDSSNLGMLSVGKLAGAKKSNFTMTTNVGMKSVIIHAVKTNADFVKDASRTRSCPH